MLGDWDASAGIDRRNCRRGRLYCGTRPRRARGACSLHHRRRSGSAAHRPSRICFSVTDVLAFSQEEPNHIHERRAMTKRPKPIVLTVLDGWGYRAETKGNAIALARKPAYDELIQKFPNTLIHTAGPFVGLPEGQMGNSEVGHMNMGAG